MLRRKRRDCAARIARRRGAPCKAKCARTRTRMAKNTDLPVVVFGFAFLAVVRAEIVGYKAHRPSTSSSSKEQQLARGWQRSEHVRSTAARGGLCCSHSLRSFRLDDGGAAAAAAVATLVRRCRKPFPVGRGIDTKVCRSRVCEFHSYGVLFFYYGCKTALAPTQAQHEVRDAQ